MTLILAAANQQFATLIADRRVTCNGRVLDDEQNKIIAFACRDARVAFAFTGIAQWKSFDTCQWLLKTLQQISEIHKNISDVMEELRNRASDEIPRLGAPDPLLYIVALGYAYWGTKPTLFLMDINNANSTARDSFSTTSFYEDEDGTILKQFGTTAGTSSKSLNNLRINLSTPTFKSYYAVRSGVMIIQESAADKKSKGAVGKQCNSAVLESSTNTNIVSTYHSAFDTNKVYMCGAVFGVSGGVSCFAGGTMYSPSQLLTGPQISAREPCWCSSGKLFKYCHKDMYKKINDRNLSGNGKAHVPFFNRPMSMIYRIITEEEAPSGKIFMVAGSFDLQNYSLLRRGAFIGEA